MKTSILWAMFFSLLLDFAAIAQSVQKHPKVAELERYVSKEAFEYVKGRFPGEPVLVEVSIDPLRRNVRTPGSIRTRTFFLSTLLKSQRKSMNGTTQAYPYKTSYLGFVLQV